MSKRKSAQLSLKQFRKIALIILSANPNKREMVKAYKRALGLK